MRPTEFELTVEAYRGGFRAICACGWDGPLRRPRPGFVPITAADLDRQLHERWHGEHDEAATPRS